MFLRFFWPLFTKFFERSLFHPTLGRNKSSAKSLESRGTAFFRGRASWFVWWGSVLGFYFFEFSVRFPASLKALESERSRSWRIWFWRWKFSRELRSGIGTPDGCGFVWDFQKGIWLRQEPKKSRLLLRSFWSKISTFFQYILNRVYFFPIPFYFKKVKITRKPMSPNLVQRTGSASLLFPNQYQNNANRTFYGFSAAFVSWLSFFSWTSKVVLFVNFVNREFLLIPSPLLL